ncbi:conserved hypothetical protein [Treponema primitia ZAS-2]|uniref:Uncharacterized protein n=1 Tax=Treponema primitia (strain ATCC BAA-887 / DSM 12427 / ZAS-2) TaxID=545694 RepID=F5YNV8_TREPZ|nr:hypothetical protein [Treponema primitia]AEF85980.1 conserved hypothetical protein [Treponema primitia ZAS-2]
MNSYFQMLVFVVIGVMLFWFGYNLFFGQGKKGQGSGKDNKNQEDELEGEAGAPRTCPVCSIRLLHGEKVKSSAYPSMGKADRLMSIAGCPYCLEGDRPRICPVCGAVLNYDENLVARLFDKPGRSHVHVLGCSRCRGFLGSHR